MSARARRDALLEEFAGPLRTIRRILEDYATSACVELECGHQKIASHGTLERRQRCLQCRPKRSAARLRRQRGAKAGLARGAMFSLVLALTGCRDVGPTDISSGSGTVFEHRRIDGIECIVYHAPSKGGISCDWSDR